MSDREGKTGICWTALIRRLRTFGYYILRDSPSEGDLTAEDVATWSECGSIDGARLATALKEQSYTTDTVPQRALNNTGFISNEHRYGARELSDEAKDVLVDAAKVAIGDAYREKHVPSHDLTLAEFTLMDKGYLDKNLLPTVAGWHALLTLKHDLGKNSGFTWFPRQSSGYPVERIDALCKPVKAREKVKLGRRTKDLSNEAGA